MLGEQREPNQPGGKVGNSERNCTDVQEASGSAEAGVHQESDRERGDKLERDDNGHQDQGELEGVEEPDILHHPHEETHRPLTVIGAERKEERPGQGHQEERGDVGEGGEDEPIWQRLLRD